MARIKCPNCGSTTQPELVSQDTDNYSLEHSNEYICGCGCHFKVTFAAISVEIEAETSGLDEC